MELFEYTGLTIIMNAISLTGFSLTQLHNDLFSNIVAFLNSSGVAWKETFDAFSEWKLCYNKVYHHLSYDVVTWDVDHDVSTAYC